MECPKCHRIISDNATICPHCHKVLSLICPNCKSRSNSSVCENCGYIILTKCAKCGRLIPTNQETCKCGLNVKSSLVCNECESDEFASITINFNALKAIRSLLASKELYSKFLIKLRNLILSQLKGVEGTIIIYGNSYVINFNKELSFATSVNKAVRLSLKIFNAFSGLNMRMQEELGSPLKINLVIQKKKAEELLENKFLENNVKPLMLKQNDKKYIRGMQLILDQYSQDIIEKDYKTDSLYMLEHDGNSIMYYELLLDNYILPPGNSDDIPVELGKNEKLPQKTEKDDGIYSFKVLDIKAKCQFINCYSEDLINKLRPENKIIAIRGDKSLQINTGELINHYKKNGFASIYVSCTEELNYKPWGLFEKIFKEYYQLSTANGLILQDSNYKQFNGIKELLSGSSIKTSTSEDARFAYIESFCLFLTSLKKCAIIIDGFENIDDTSIQTLKLYFDKFKNVNVNFIFITDSETSVHSKIKELLRTPLYTEITLQKNSMPTLLSNIKEDAEDFVQSFYYEKIKENFNGSKIYFEHAIKHLMDKDVIINFENRLIIRNNNSVVLPTNLVGLVKERLKSLGKYQDASMILAFSIFLGERLDFELLEKLGIKSIGENAKFLDNAGFTTTENSVIYINNYSLIRPMLQFSLKKEVREFLAKTIIAKAGKIIDDTTMINLMGTLSMFKEQYLLLWKNAQLSLSTGDYDAYLKNSLGFLSLIEKIENNIPKEAIEENKKEVFHNILISLYNYSPAKIYSIENILLVDAMNANDNENIVKLSNLMLQGALITSNYSVALSLLHNILERMEHPQLVVDGVINTKFLLLSLVNIEILFNIGDYRSCIEIGENIISLIKPDMLEKIKPVNFSISSFINHLSDTYRLIGFAKLLTLDSDINKFFDSVKNSINEELPEKECILAIKEFLKGKKYVPSNIEEATPFSKIIYLILQELSMLKNDYKTFAQNIYQAKLLAVDIHQAQLEYICDLLIAYAYSKIGIISKANYICNDVLEKSENSAIFNIMILSNYLIAKTKIASGEIEEALIIINNALDDIQRYSNQAKIFYAMFEKLYINIMSENNPNDIDYESEQNKLFSICENDDLERIIRKSEFDKSKKDEFIEESPKETDELAEIQEDFSEK